MRHNPIRLEKGFLKAVERLSTSEQDQVAKAIDLLRQNTDHPSLKTRQYKRRKAERFRLSDVNMRLRLIWRRGPGGEIVIVTIATHDQL